MVRGSGYEAFCWPLSLPHGVFLVAMLQSHVVEFFVLLCALGLQFLHTQKLIRNAGSRPFQTCWGSIYTFTNFLAALTSQKAPVSRMIRQEPRGQSIVLAAQHPEWEHWTPSPKVSIMFLFFISPKLQLRAPSVSSAPTRGTPTPPPHTLQALMWNTAQSEEGTTFHRMLWKMVGFRAASQP